jgi:hypothetical protein
MPQPLHAKKVVVSGRIDAPDTSLYVTTINVVSIPPAHDHTGRPFELEPKTPISGRKHSRRRCGGLLAADGELGPQWLDRQTPVAIAPP